MGWTVVVNPAAGRGHTNKRIPHLLAAIEALGTRGVDADAYVSVSAGDAIEHAAKAAAAGRDLVAAGGDGTVGAIAGVAAEAGCCLAIVPVGSGNDFATTLGYDRKQPLTALAALTDDGGVERVIDLGRVSIAGNDPRYYCCVTASGFDAEANRWANTVRRLSGTPLYVAAVLRTLATYRPHPFRVTVDGESHEITAWLVAVGNGPAYGGGMRVAPDAQLDDGLLDVCAIGKISRAKFLLNFPKVFSGRHVEMPEVQQFRARAVTVESLDSSLPLELYADGERFGALPATIEAAPNALRVRVPRAAVS